MNAVVKRLKKCLDWPVRRLLQPQLKELSSCAGVWNISQPRSGLSAFNFFGWLSNGSFSENYYQASGWSRACHLSTLHLFNSCFISFK